VAFIREGEGTAAVCGQAATHRNWARATGETGACDQEVLAMVIEEKVEGVLVVERFSLKVEGL
jgi:hypothetical protein